MNGSDHLMAELEARYDDPQAGLRLLWRHILPPDREVSVGRIPLTQADVAPENRSEWVTDPRDTFVSGCHAFVRWDGESLHVRIRTHPKKPQNPIFFQREAQDSFAARPGQGFAIGNTSFVVHAGDTDAAPASDPEPTAALHTQYRLGPNDLRQIRFHDPAHILKALARFPTLIGYARDDATRDETLLKLVAESLPPADVAALVRLDDRVKEARAAVQQVFEKRPRRDGMDFAPSYKLTRRALMEMENTLHVRGQEFDPAAADVTFGTGVDWAVCAPLIEDGPYRMGLYVAGHLPPGRPVAGEAPPELEDYQKVVGLAAQIYKSACELRRAEHQLSRYQGFLSRNVITLLNAANSKDLLEPKETDVTVIFCDLRGASKLAEQRAADLLGNWGHISQALDVMTAAITDEGGVIGDLQGDAAMGFWGWPLAQPDAVQVERAARAALRIQRDFARGKAPAGCVCGVGLAFGKAVAGKLGTADQIKLDVFGPVVNLASRLEGLTKAFGVPILADERVVAALPAGEPAGLAFQTRSLGKVIPAGMTVATGVYELAPAGEFTDRQKALWEAAQKAFAAGRFATARDKLDEFGVTGGRAAGDRAADLLRARMAPHGDKAPAGWDGILCFDAK